MNGILPTAFLGSANVTGSLRNFSAFWMTYQKDHQESDGWVGPGSLTNPIVNQQYTNQSYDTYPTLMHLMAMAQWHDATQDADILKTMIALMHKLSELYREPQCVRPRGRTIWPVCGGGACAGGVCKCCVTSRYPELAWSVLWLHDRTKDPWLLSFLQQIHDSLAIYPNWVDFFSHFNCTKAYTVAQCGAQHLAHHGVDIAEGIKYGALRYRLTGDQADLDASLKAVRVLWQYHGQADGVMSNDENLGGLEPHHGTETCSVVETLFSLATTAMISGSVEVADAAERVAYNAMPGFSTPNQWGHVYFQYSNQPRSGASGSQTHYKTWAGTIPCCTANHPQGWAKWSQHLVAKTVRDGRSGLAVVHYAPIVANTSVAGRQVQLTVDTEYPWRDTVTLAVRSPGAPAAFRLPLCFRIPGWCLDASVVAHSGTVSLPSALQPNSYACATVGAEAAFTIRLAMGAGRIERRVANAAVILRGPLVFSLPVSERWVAGEGPSASLAEADGDFGYNLALTNTSLWAFALNLSSLEFEDVPGPLPAVPWDRTMLHPGTGERALAPVVARVQAQRLPEWEADANLRCFECAGLDAPCGPVNSSRVEGPPVTLTLAPYGSTQLRVTEWPVLAGPRQPPGEAQPCPPPPALPTSCPPINETSLPPNAMPNINMPCGGSHPDPGCDLVPHGQKVAGMADCWRLCQANAECQAWVFSRGGYSPGVHGGSPWCWLKNASNIAPSRKQCFVSAACKPGSAWPCSSEPQATEPDACVGYLVAGAGSPAYDGCYKPQGKSFVLDATHQLYEWQGVWRLGDTGKAVAYLAADASSAPPESSGGCNGPWLARSGGDPCPSVKRVGLPPVPPAPPPPPPPPPPHLPPPPPMSLVWEDHFDGDSLNASRWRVLEQVHRGGVYTKENVQVADGVLTLLTVAQNVTIDQGGQPTKFYVSSGAVNTSGLLEQRHGRWEVRVKLPAVALSRGYTLHSSIWLFADSRNPARTGCPQEIDVVEQYTAGDSNVSNAVANLHPFAGCASVGHAAGFAHTRARAPAPKCRTPVRAAPRRAATGRRTGLFSLSIGRRAGSACASMACRTRPSSPRPPTPPRSPRSRTSSSWR